MERQKAYKKYTLDVITYGLLLIFGNGWFTLTFFFFLSLACKLKRNHYFVALLVKLLGHLGLLARTRSAPSWAKSSGGFSLKSHREPPSSAGGYSGKTPFASLIMVEQTLCVICEQTCIPKTTALSALPYAPACQCPQSDEFFPLT